MSSLLSIKDYVNIMISRYSNKDYNAIDMTLGNGHDSLILSDNFKGDREYCLERVKYYVIKLYKEGKIKNISPERILYYELAE